MTRKELTDKLSIYIPQGKIDNKPYEVFTGLAEAVSEMKRLMLDARV